MYFLTNSGLIAVAIGLDARRSPVAVWREHFLWLSVNYFAAASVSFCLVLLMYQANLLAAIVFVPLLVVLHLTLRSSFGRLDDARQHLAHLDRLYLSTVETLAMAIDAKDDVTHSHVRRVQAYALGLARALGVTDEPTLKGIEAAALLHDTGKLAVPEHILNKPGKLSEAEFEQMKRHVDVGADILSLVDFPYPVVPIVRCHHENWDGSGYPRGVAGTDIPIGARILSVVDCFDALTSDRPYRSALSDEAAFDILRARRGTMYEPMVVDTFIRVHRELVEQMASFPAHDALRQITRSAAGREPGARCRWSSRRTACRTTSRVRQPRAPRVGRRVDGRRAVAGVGSHARARAGCDDRLVRDGRRQADVSCCATRPVRPRGRCRARPPPGRRCERLGGRQSPGHHQFGGVARPRRAGALRLPLKHALSVPLITRESLVGTITLYARRRSPRARAGSCR